jgi:hypothetical protein
LLAISKGAKFMQFSSKRTILLDFPSAALVFAVLLTAALLVSGAAARGQAPSARAVLDKGVAATGPTGADVPAWHIKANYSLYDRGNLTESGTLEEWATGP